MSGGAVGRALSLPNDVLFSLLTVCQLVIEMAGELSARRGERFERFLLACEADARGRGPELRARPYPQAAQLRAARTAAASVRLPPEVLERDQGPVIAERLRAARIEAIRSLNQA